MDRWRDVLLLLPDEDTPASPTSSEARHVALEPRAPDDVEMDSALDSTLVPVTPAASTTTLQESHAIQVSPTASTTPLPVIQAIEGMPTRSSASSPLSTLPSLHQSPARSVSISPSHVSPKVASDRRAQSLSAVGGVPTPVNPLPVSNAKKSEVPARPTTGGKSLEYLAKLGLAPYPKLTITLKRSRQSIGKNRDEEYVDSGGESQEDDENEDGIDGDDDDEEFVKGPGPRPKKKHRIVSANIIESDEERPGRRMKPASNPRTLEDWPYYPSPNPCQACVSAQRDCGTFELYPEGFRSQKQRRSCTHCYLRKRKCVFNDIHRDRELQRPTQKGKARSKDRGAAKPRKASTKSKKATDVDREDKDAETTKTSGAKGKGKVRQEETAQTQSGDEGEAGRMTPQRPSRNRQARFRSGKSLFGS